MIHPFVDLFVWCVLGGVYVWLLWIWRDMSRFGQWWYYGILILVVGWIIYSGIKVLEALEFLFSNGT